MYRGGLQKQAGSHISKLELKFTSVLFMFPASDLGSVGVQWKTLYCHAKLIPGPGVSEVKEDLVGGWSSG